jgi:hypothetical protein
MFGCLGRGGESLLTKGVVGFQSEYGGDEPESPGFAAGGDVGAGL